MGRWTLRELNGMDRERFTETLGGIFEHSSWIPAEAWKDRPFGSLEELHAALLQVLREAGEEAQLALLHAHPDLGARIAMTEDSVKEQSGAGLDHLSRREYRRLQALNKLYRAKFGFPFILAVKGKTVEDVFASIRSRCRNGRKIELARALQEVCRISRFRLEDALSDAKE